MKSPISIKNVYFVKNGFAYKLQKGLIKTHKSESRLKNITEQRVKEKKKKLS